MRNSYTEAFSGGTAKGGSGYFSSSAWEITSESAIHFSSSLINGTFPSGLIFKNLAMKSKHKSENYTVTVQQFATC